MADVGRNIEDTYTAHLKVDERGAVKGLRIFGQKTEKMLKGVSTQTKKLDKLQREAFKASDKNVKNELNQLKDRHKSNVQVQKDVSEQEKAHREKNKEASKARDIAEEEANAVGKVAKEKKKADKSQRGSKVEESIEEYSSLFAKVKKVSEAHKANTKAAKASVESLKSQIKDTTEQVEELKRGLKSVPVEDEKRRTSFEQAIKDQEAQLEDFKKSYSDLDVELDAHVTVSSKALVEVAEKAGEKISAPFEALLAKDFKRSFKSGAELAGSILKNYIAKGADKLSAPISGLGKRLAAKGSGMRAGAGPVGKVAGFGLEKFGGALKGLGDLGGKLGSIAKTLGSVGPILGLIGGAFGALVKLFIDADAQAKEFNKELLQSASTGEFLARSAGNAGMAFEDLKDTVDSIRNSAFNLKQNLDWGTTAKDHLAFRNVLTQEGVSIARMGDEFERTKQAGNFAGDAVDYFSRQLSTTIAFSRQFGVALNDVTQFQAEMMSELGVSFEHVTDSFTVMAKVASDSGIAMNKFFGILRGVSADLTLYNVRMETAILLLGRLGKVMSPKNAQKFLQTLMRGFKDMDVMDRVKMTLLAGQKRTKEIVESDIAKREANLVKAVAERLGVKGEEDLEQIRRAVSEDKAGRGQALKKLLEGVEGGGALREESLEIRRMAKTSSRGLFGLAQSIRGLSIKGTMEMTKAAIMRFAGPGTKTLEEATAQLGPAMMAKNLNVSEEQLEGLIKFEVATKEAEQELLAQGKTQQEIDQMGDEDLLKAMGMDKDEVKKLLSSQKDFAQDQTKLMQSWLDKLDLLIQFMMNEFYNVVISIWDAITSLPGQSEARKQFAVFKAIRESGNKALTQAWGKTGGDVYKYKGEVVAEVSKKGLSEALRRQPQSPEEAKRLEAIKEQLVKAPSLNQQGLEEAMRAAQIDPERMKKLVELRKKRETEEAVKTARMGEAALYAPTEIPGLTYEDLKAVLSPEEMAATLEKIPWMMTPDANYSKSMGELIKSLDELAEETKKAKEDKEKEDKERRTREKLQAQAGYALRPTLEEAGRAPVKPEGLSPQDAATVESFFASTKLVNAAIADATKVKPAAPAAVTVAPPAADVPKPVTQELSAENAALVESFFASTKLVNAAIADATKVKPATPTAAAPPVKIQPSDKPIDIQSPPLPTDEAMVDLSKEQIGTLDGIHKALRVKGIKIDRAFLKDHIGKQMETSVLDAAREALFEYWLYQETDRKDVLQGMKEGKIETGKDFARLAKKQALDTGKELKGQEKDIFSETNIKSLKENAKGGIVTGVRGNIAQIAPLPPPAPGEGWASVGPQETILPAGGPPPVGPAPAAPRGGGAQRLDLNVNVTGTMGADFNSFLQTTITNAIYDYEKRKRLM